MTVWWWVQVLKRVVKEPDIRAIFNGARGGLKKAFESRSNKSFSATQAATMSLEDLIEGMKVPPATAGLLLTTQCPRSHRHLTDDARFSRVRG